MKSFNFNTSNKGKQAEITRFLSAHNITPNFTNIDLDEPATQDQDIIVAYKATKVPGTFIEDSGLFIENAEVGTDVRWVEDELDKYEGRRAKFTTLFGYFDGERVSIFEGIIHGKVCKTVPGAGFGFDKNFVPDGNPEGVPNSISKPDTANPRFLALTKIIEGIPSRIITPQEWNGRMQNE